MTDKPVGKTEPENTAQPEGSNERRVLTKLLVMCLASSAIRLALGVFARYRWGVHHQWGVLGCCINAVQLGLTLLCALPALAPGSRRKWFAVATIMGVIVYALTWDMCPPVFDDSN
jgi:hypothetical protein